jgi:hypothetical protein
MGQLTSSATACGSDGYYVDYFGNILGKVSALTPVVYSWGDGCRRGKEQNIDAKASWGYSCGTGEGGRYLCKGVQGDIFAMSSNGDVSLAAGCVPKKGVLGTSSAKVCIPSYYKFGNIRVSAYGNAEGQSYVNGKYVGLGNGKTWKAEVETQYGVSPCIRKIDFYVRMCAGMTHGSICCSAMYNNCYVNPNSNLFNKLCGYGQVGDQFAWWNRWYKGNAGYRYVTDSCQVISGAPGTYGLDLKTTYGSPVSLVLEDEPEVSPTITNNFKLNTAQKDHWVIWRASSKRPLVVYDPKKSGKVTAVTQLFGTNTFGKTWRDGFEALASLDKNQDGKVAGDELKDLSLWFDKNQNAVSEKGEVVDLISYGVTELFYSKDGNDVRTADILANKGYTLVKNGKTITGLSIDWFTALYESKSAAQAALEEFKKMQAAAGQQTRSEPKVDAETQAFEGTWRWQIDEKYINAENLERGANTTGLFVLVSGEEGGNSVDGTSTIQVGVEPNSDKVETAVVNFWLENAKTYNEHGVQFLSWTIQDERIGLFSESVAELSEDGTTLYGVSRDDLKDPKTLVRSSRHYTWKAMKLEI